MGKKLRSAGALFKAEDSGRVLFVLRSMQKSFPNKWEFPGGKIYSSEYLTEGLKREIIEELGFFPEIIKYSPLNYFSSDDENFKYVSVIIKTPIEFIPSLNPEHTGYAWVNIDHPPYPLHIRIKELLDTSLIKDSIKNF